MARIRETDVSDERFNRAHGVEIELPKRQGIGVRAWIGLAIVAVAIALYAYTQGAGG